MQISGFDLTFQKWSESFSKENNVILNVSHYGRETEKIFHSRSPKGALSTFSSCWRTSDLHLIPAEFYKKMYWRGAKQLPCSQSNDEVTPYLIKRHLQKSTIWVYLKWQLNMPKQRFIQFTANNRNQSVGLILD